MCAKKTRRRFVPNVCNHIYQRSVGGFNIFYDREDYLLCYMIMSVIAKKRNVSILEICFMINHIHILVDSDTCEQLADFIRDYTSLYVMEYNASIGRNGRLFHKSFGSAPKCGDKKMRSVIVYIGNNPVEKCLCRCAEDYRWNFLRYFVDDHPFSQNLTSKRRSRKLERCMKRVKAVAESGCYMNYIQLYDMFSSLSESEAEYLTDYIIVKYFPFDKERLLAYYDDWQQMIEAMHSSAGSEYDIAEKWYTKSDTIFSQMIACIKEKFHIYPVRKVVTLPYSQKKLVMDELRKSTSATLYEISKFLHLPNSGT